MTDPSLSSQPSYSMDPAFARMVVDSAAKSFGFTVGGTIADFTQFISTGIARDASISAGQQLNNSIAWLQKMGDMAAQVARSSTGDVATRSMAAQVEESLSAANLDQLRTGNAEAIAKVAKGVGLGLGLLGAAVGVVEGRSSNQLGGALAGAVTGLLGLLVMVAAAPLELGVVGLLAVGLIGWGLTSLVDGLFSWLDKEFNIFDSVNDFYLNARNYRWRPDPLALDLDGDGIETIADNGSVLFDFDGDGVRNVTGWVGRDDGLLVLDRNGNGSIDNGGELFGADTVLANGQRATSGFQALRDLDSNSDGQFNADDAQFGAVRVWRDLNQDGASQTNELFTLDQLDIAAINLTPTSVADVNLGGGNAIDNSGVYTRTDGSQGGAYDLLLQRNMFFRDFSNSPLPVPITDEAAALPNVQGSGAVRDLVEAASLFARTWHATFLRTFHAMPRPANSFV